MDTAFYEARKSLPGCDLNELMDCQFSPRRQFLGPWIQSSGLVLLYATRGLGKTWIAAKIAHTIASGGAFLGRQAEEARVVYFDGEMGKQAMQSRLLTVDSGADQGVPARNFLLASIDDFGGELPNLSEPKGQELYSRYLDHYDVAVIDNLQSASSRLTARDDDVSEWERIGRWAMKERMRGKCIIFVHHASKAGVQHGTSKRENLVNTIIGMRPARIQIDKDATEFELHFEKGRDFWGKDKLSLFVSLTPTETAIQFDHMFMTEALRMMARRMYGDGIPEADIRTALGITRAELSEYIQEGVARAEVEPEFLDALERSYGPF